MLDKPGTYVDYPTKSSDGISSIENVTSDRRIFHDTACHHDSIFSCICQLFNNQVNHLPQGGIFVLEELRDAKKEGCCFIGWELLPGKEKESNLGK